MHFHFDEIHLFTDSVIEETENAFESTSMCMEEILIVYSFNLSINNQETCNISRPDIL